MTRTWIALAIVFVLASCSSDGAPATVPTAAPFVAPSVTTTIALDDRPTYVNDDVWMFLESSVENESALISFEAAYDDGTKANDEISVTLGQAVSFEGWTVHVEAIGPSSFLYWTVDPDGVQVGGEPRE